MKARIQMPKLYILLPYIPSLNIYVKNAPSAIAGMKN